MQRIVVATCVHAKDSALSISDTVPPERAKSDGSRHTGTPAASAWRMRSRLAGDALPLQIKVRSPCAPSTGATSGLRSSQPR